MPRITKQKTRSERICPKCGRVIKPGETYRKWAFFRSKPNIRCMDRNCDPKDSELTQNTYFRGIALAKETEISISSFEDATAAIDAVITDLEEVRDEQEDKFDNMPEGFKYGETGEELERQIDVLNSVLDTLEGIEVPDEDEILEKREELSEELTGTMDPEDELEEAMMEWTASRCYEIEAEIDEAINELE